MHARQAIRWLVYPVLMGGSLLLLWGLLQAGLSLAFAPYVAIAITGPLVLIAERLVPFRTEWQPEGAELIDDSLYLALVQVVWPLILGWTLVWLAQGWLGSAGAVLDVWPRHWPIWAQLVAQDRDRRFLPLLAAPRRPHLAAALASPCRSSPAGEALHDQRVPLPSGREGAAVPVRYAAVHPASASGRRCSPTTSSSMR